MISRSSYKSKVELTLITEKGKEINIPSYYINSVIADYKFEDSIMPIIYLQLQINIELYNTIVNNSREGKFFFSLKNYDVRNEMSIEKDSIRSQFIYFLPPDANISKQVDFPDYDPATKTRSLLIGLIKIELMNQNRVAYSGIYNNTDTISLLNYTLSDLKKVIISDIENNTEYPKFIFTPRDTRSEAIQFIFDTDEFYNTMYILFYDFEITYLINRNGKPANENSNMNTVIFNINQVNETGAIVDGIFKDIPSNSYNIFVSTSDTNININSSTGKNINTIVGVDKDSVSISNLYDNKSIASINKSSNINNNKISFVRSGRIGTKILKNQIDNTLVLTQISKMYIDSSIITPDKAYFINYSNPDYKKYNGRYLLISKKDVYLKSGGEEFIPLTQMEFRYISEQ